MSDRERNAPYRKKLTVAAVTLLAAGICVLSACTAANPVGPASGSDDSAPIVDAAYWADKYPHQYASYVDAGYAKYGQPDENGKINAFWDAAHTKLDVPSTGCMRCHTSQFNQFSEKYGKDFLTADYEMIRRDIKSGVSCYSCHGNNPGTLQVTNTWITDAAEKGGIKTSTGNLVCAQCHSAPDWSTILTDSDPSTWSTLQVGVDPDAVWDYFQAEGYDDPLVFDQENEFANFYGSTMFEAGAECSNCHMAKMPDGDNGSYTQHQFQGVGDNEALYDNCLKCHTDSTVEKRKAAVSQVQSDYSARLTSTKAVVGQFADEVTAAQSAGTADQDKLQKATKLMNKAKFYLSWGTDTSKGIHSMGHSAVSDCFDKAVATANAGMALLG